MKIIGLLTAWAAEDWIEYSIKQALTLVDELILSIGPFDNYLEEIKDNTLKIAQKYSNHRKVKIVKTVHSPFNTLNQNKCVNLNRMLKVSENIEVGNIIWILDVDEFYSNEAIKEVLDFINNKDFDSIRVVSRFFAINFNYYIKISHERIFKIKNKNCYFTPTQRFHPTPIKKALLLEKNPMFHYSMLTGNQKQIQWLVHNSYKALIWFRKIYNHYDPNNEDFWMKKNLEVTGHYGFWIRSAESREEKNNHGLFKYNGKHPEIIENSHLRNINDFRKYFLKKPQNEQINKILKEIIKDKKRFRIKLRDFYVFKLKRLFKMILQIIISFTKKDLKKKLNLLKRTKLIQLILFKFKIKYNY